MPTLYRAAKDDYIDQGYSFAETLETARVYMDNPGFGGAHLFSATADEDQAVDLTDISAAELAVRLGEPDPGAIGVDEWLPRVPAVLGALRAEGHLWAIVSESYPADTRTWIWLGGALDDEPELIAVET